MFILLFFHNLLGVSLGEDFVHQWIFNIIQLIGLPLLPRHSGGSLHVMYFKQELWWSVGVIH